MARLIQQFLTQTTFSVLNGSQGNQLGGFDKGDHLLFLQGIHNIREVEWFIQMLWNNSSLLHQHHTDGKKLSSNGKGYGSQDMDGKGIRFLIPQRKIFWQIWVHENRPLICLRWDPGKYEWLDPFNGLDTKKTLFYHYSVKIGRRVLASHKATIPAVITHWMQFDRSENIFWETQKRLWSQRRPVK